MAKILYIVNIFSIFYCPLFLTMVSNFEGEGQHQNPSKKLGEGPEKNVGRTQSITIFI